MKSYLLVAALASSLSLAQNLPLDAYDSLGDCPNFGAPYTEEPDTATVSYIPTAAQTSAMSAMAIAIANGVTTVINAPTSTALPIPKRGLFERGTCVASKPGNGPTVNSPDDSVGSFYGDSIISDTALDAVAPVGYALADGFLNLYASAMSPTYLTYTTVGVTSYDPSVCASKCDNIAGCVSFNIYFERDPSEDPDQMDCPNPHSLTRIKCAFFGSMITTRDATNSGQLQASFQIVIAGSNAYNKFPATTSGYSGPVDFGAAAINAPLADHSYLRVQTFSQTHSYDPSVCAAVCNMTTVYAQQHNSTRDCRFFNSYILYKNGVNGSFTCAYYSQSYGASFATNTGQYNEAGDHFTIGTSMGFTAIGNITKRALRGRVGDMRK